MNHHGVASRLPVELLSMIFDYLALQGLLGASHVSKFWRAVASRHRTYWSDITLEALSTTALDFFHARLDAGSARSVTLRVYVCKPRFPTDLRSLVLPAIARNLYRVDKLYLEADTAYDRDVFSALRHPAPRLVTFAIYMAHETKTSDALPADLFAGHAPSLQNVQLVNAQLRADKFPKAFTSVVFLKFCFDEALSFPTAVFSHCNALQKLIIYGQHCSVASGGEVSSIVDAQKLRFVDMIVFTGSFDLMRRLPCSSIAQISVPMIDKECGCLLLGHLRGRLEVQLRHTDEDVYLHYQSLDTGMQRTFPCAFGQIAAAYLPPVYVDAALLSRVQTLRSSSICAGLFPAFGELPACTRIALTMADGEPLKPPPRPLSTPELQQIEISSSAAARVSADDLAAFLDAAFAPVSRTVQVTLEGVSVDGDLAAIPSDRFVLSHEQSAVTVEDVLPVPDSRTRGRIT